MAKDRAYDPKRRPDIFYKNDPASDQELRKRSFERNELASKNTLSETVSKDIGYGDSEVAISEGGGWLENVRGIANPQGEYVWGGTAKNVNISGFDIAKGKAIRKYVESNKKSN